MVLVSWRAWFGLTSVPSVTSVTRRWMKLRYGSSRLAGCWWRHKSTSSAQEAELVCQKFIDFYLEQCKQELVRDRRQGLHSEGWCGGLAGKGCTVRAGVADSVRS